LRLVAWNSNYNTQRRSLEASVALVEHLNADILVISETGPVAPVGGLRAWYVGDVPGLAVVASDGVDLFPCPENEGAPPRMLGFAVRGKFNFDLLAAWPVSRKGDPSYHEVLMTAVDRYARILGGERVIVAGDLNSNTRVSFQRDTHPRFVSAMSDLGLRSVYHAASGEPHGEESIPTYRHSPGPQRDFHLDYAFVSAALAGTAELKILHDSYWMTVGDHYPLVLEVHDNALAAPL